MLGSGNALPMSRRKGVDITNPTVLSAEVGGLAVNIVVITMSELLNSGIVPSTTAFDVDDGAANVVTDVNIVGSDVQLTLTNDIDSGDTVVVSYTKPGSNPLQDLAANEADSWVDESVNNNVGVPGVWDDNDNSGVWDDDANEGVWDDNA